MLVVKDLTVGHQREYRPTDSRIQKLFEVPFPGLQVVADESVNVKV